MKIESLVVALLYTMCLGCDRPPTSPAPNAPPPPPAAKAPIEVDAPGAHVEVGGGKGVDVKTPGADVEVPPAAPK